MTFQQQEVHRSQQADRLQAAVTTGDTTISAEAQEVVRGRRKPGRVLSQQDRALRIRRTIGLLLIAGFSYAAYHVVFHTQLLEPMLAQVVPVQGLLEWVVADPHRTWMAAAVLVIPHIGLHFLLFDDRNL